MAFFDEKCLFILDNESFFFSSKSYAIIIMIVLIDCKIKTHEDILITSVWIPGLYHS